MSLFIRFSIFCLQIFTLDPCIFSIYPYAQCIYCSDSLTDSTLCFCILTGYLHDSDMIIY